MPYRVIMPGVGFMTERKLSRYRQDRILGGVASGLAAYVGVHPALVRLAIVFAALGLISIPRLDALVIIAYFAAWALVPEISPELEVGAKPLLPGLVRPKHGRRVEGVCVGIARAYKLDVNLVRVVMIVLVFFGGLGLVTYVAGWILMPNETTFEPDDAEHIARDQKGDRS
jgi:phage shock protein PspC (stress-responsive transcriptional regulator)